MADGGTPDLARAVLSNIVQAILNNRPKGITEDYVLGFFERNEQNILQMLAPIIQSYSAQNRPQAQAVLPEFWTAKARTEANIAAMRLLATRKPDELTAADRDLLGRYSGWGGLSLQNARHQFPPGFPVPEERGLIHEYYTPTAIAREIARLVAPLLDDLVDAGEPVHVLEPSAGIGRFIRAFSGVRNLIWHVAEWSDVSGRLLAALYPDIDLHIGPFEQWVARHGARWHGRINLVLSNPPYGPRGSSIADDPDRSYREKMAYHYFLRRSLDLLAPNGLGVFLVPGGFLTSRTATFRGLREKVLKRHHLSAAFRLPSVRPGGREAVFPGAMLVTDLLFFRARGGELDAVDAADEGILNGNYYQEFPEHILGREVGRDAGDDDQTTSPRWGYQVVGEFRQLPPLVERALCSACTVVPISAPSTKGGATSRTGVVRDVLADVVNAPGDVGAALQLGVRVDRYLGLVAAQVPYEPGQLWPELHNALLDWVRKNGTPAAHVELAQLAKEGNSAAQRFVNAFDRLGNLLEVLDSPPKEPEPVFNGEAHDIVAQAELLYRQRNSVLTVDQLLEFHASVGGSLQVDAALQSLVKSGWCFDGPAWNMLVPKADYLTGNLWEKYDIAGQPHSGPMPAWVYDSTEQRRQLLAAIKPAVFEDIEGLSPRQAWVPLNLVESWMKAQFSDYGTSRHAKLKREHGLLTVEGASYEDGELPMEWHQVLGWINHDKTLFRPSVSRDEDLDQKRLEVAAAWEIGFRTWVMKDPARVDQIVTAYNRLFRGYVAPSYSSEPLPIARWTKSGPRLRPHQVAGARRILANRGGLLAFDVGVGKTYTGIAILARARQEGWAKRPVVVVPNSIVWNWVEEMQKVLPDYRVVVIGSKQKIISRGPRKGFLTSETDDEKERAEKWTRFQGGEYDAALVTYTSFPRTRMNLAAVESYVNGIAAVRREITLRRRNAKKRDGERISERQEALLKEGVGAWIAEKLELPKDWVYDPGPAWDDIGIDLLIVDEAQNFKNLYAPAEREGGVPRFMGNSGEGSDRSWQMDFRCAAVRRNAGGRGIVLLSATPAKNSPLEFYNLIQYVDPDAWSRMGIMDPEQFIDRYVRTEIKSVLNTKLAVEDRSAAVGFTNLHELRDVIFRYGDFKTAEDVGLKLPEPKVEFVEVNMDTRQTDKYDRYISLIEESLQDFRKAGAILGYLAKMALVSIHADLDDGHDWKSASSSMINPNSSKFTALADRILLNKSCGHIVFVDNIAAHVWIKRVLEARGVPGERIALLNAVAAKATADRQQIARHFNGDPNEGILPLYDVVIANAVAYEGINLQTRTCAIHHLDLPWEPATLQQRNGRGVRQGNTLATITIYYYFAKRSSDGLRFNLIQGKRGWMTELIKSQDRATNNPGAHMEMGPEEILLMISRNPEETRQRLDEVRAKREAEARAKIADEATKFLRAINTRFRMAERAQSPEDARDHRIGAEARLENLLQVDPEAWPWAPWISVVRDQPILIADGSGPVYSGLRMAIPNPYRKDQTIWVEWGMVSLDGLMSTIARRVAGSGRWEKFLQTSDELQKFQVSWYDASQWPADDDEATVKELKQTIDGLTRHGRLAQPNTMPSEMGWQYAPDAWVQRIWEQTKDSVYAALQRMWNHSLQAQRLPLQVAGNLEIGNANRVRGPDGLLPPTATGWKLFLDMAPRSGVAFTELERVGLAWWGRRIPRDLLSAASK